MNDPNETLLGFAGSPGVAIGTAVLLGGPALSAPRRSIEPSGCDAELMRFRQATERAKAQLQVAVSQLGGVTSASSVLEAYALMVDDPMLRDAVEARIRSELRCAEWAVSLSVEAIAARLARAESPYLRERSRDIEFVGEHVLRGFASHSTVLRPVSGPVVLVARDLSPADTAMFVVNVSAPDDTQARLSAPLLPGATIVALATEGGSRTSHTSITARALKLPAVVGVSELLESVQSGERLIVDGLRGTITVNPTADELREAEGRGVRYRAFSQALAKIQSSSSQTRDGVRVWVRANVENPDEAREAERLGGEGVGLYRTEYLYVDRAEPPSEEEQLAAYQEVIRAMPNRPVVLRTFDIGGDKFVSTFKLPPELNPMLGLRALRLAASRPEVFQEQLCAMLLAAKEGDVRIMVPMVCSISEFRWVKSMVEKARQDLLSRGHELSSAVPLGAMIEVPSAAIVADQFAREASFMSIGTNDLIQYTMAVDRSSRRLAHLASPFDPAVLRLVAGVVDAGARHACPVSVCGGMAGDPLTALLLLGLGVREFSMEVAAIAEIRETFRRFDLDEARHVAAQALELSSAEEIELFVAEALAPRLHDILAGEELDA